MYDKYQRDSLAAQRQNARAQALTAAIAWLGSGLGSPQFLDATPGAEEQLLTQTTDRFLYFIENGRWPE